MANDDGFLSRWSRRKVQARTGEALPPEAAPALQKPLAAATPVAPNTAGAAAQTPSLQTSDGHASADAQAQADQPNPDAQAAAAATQAPLPTMQDVMALTKESDYSAFVKPGVDPTVRNAAMKKLFSDPFFNEMDGLDIYIDDYSQPNPLPLSLARKLTSAKVLNLFETPEEKAARLAAEAAKEAKEAEANAIDAPAQPATQAEPVVGDASAPPAESDGRAADASGPTTP